MRHPLLIGIIMILSCGLAQAQSFPQLVNYQGKLTDATGQPLPTSDYTLEFNIYDAASGGSQVWGPQLFDGVAGTGHGAKVPVVQGYFNVVLGPADKNSWPIVAAFSGPNRYLGIKVSGGAEISPRQQILSTPYALNGVPAGTIVAFGGDNPPPGWLLCNGFPVSSKKYPALFAAIGKSWGDGSWLGDGTTDFNLPDLIGLFLRGKDDPNYGSRDPDRDSRGVLKPGGNSGRNVGSVQWDATRMPNNPFSTDQQGSHNHTLPDQFLNIWHHDSGGTGYGAWTVGSLGSGIATSSNGLHNHSIGGGDNETRPKNAYVDWIIKY